MRELGCDITAADDYQMLGQFGDAHHRVTGVVLDPALQDGRRNQWARTRRDDHLVGGELVAGVGAQQIASVRLDRSESGVLVVHVDVR